MDRYTAYSYRSWYYYTVPHPNPSSIGIGYGIYYYATHKPKKSQEPSASQQIEDLKQEIRAADSRIKQLDNYLKEKSYAKIPTIS